MPDIKLHSQNCQTFFSHQQQPNMCDKKVTFTWAFAFLITPKGELHGQLLLMLQLSLRVSPSKLNWKILPAKLMHTYLRYSKQKSAAFRLSKRIIKFQMLLKQKQHKLWKPHHVNTGSAVRSSHWNSRASSVPDWQNHPILIRNPLKLTPLEVRMC